jgi:hypothetical protein
MYGTPGAHDYWWCLLAWMLTWGAVLHMPPGAREVKAQYRLNFWHAVVSSIIALSCLYDPSRVPESITTSCSQAYFITDLVNMIMNDFVYKVGGYHKKTARRVEYIHHTLCIIVCFTSELAISDVCTLTDKEVWGVAPSGQPLNPTTRIMMAELSTPFLMRWRMTDEKHNYLFYLFTVMFLLSRIGYHGLSLVPYLGNNCKPWVWPCFCIPYILLQLTFAYFVLRKAHAMYTGKKLWSKEDEDRGFSMHKENKKKK